MESHEHTLHVMLQTKRKMAYTLYRILTVGSFEFFYNNIEDAEQQTTVKYKMETRVQYYICKHTDVQWSQVRDIMNMSYYECEQIIQLLSMVDYSTIRDWWHDGGQDQSYKEREAVKLQQRLSQIAIVFRVNNTGFVYRCEKTCSYHIVQKPEEATGWSHTCDIESIELVLGHMYDTVKPITLNKQNIGSIIESQ